MPGAVGSARTSCFRRGSGDHRVATSRATSLVQAHARVRDLMSDPAWKERWRQRVAEGHGKRPPVRVTCAICGTEFDVPAAVVAAGRGKTCSRACANESRRRSGKANRPPDGLETRAKKQTAVRNHVLQSDAFRTMAARLALLDSAAFDSLPERDREIVRRYDGLDPYQPQSQEEIGQLFGLARRNVGYVIKRRCAFLLDRPS